ncbi:MAG TPA: M48 family metallopeptidase [Rhodocyclaceae bacterium]
MKLSHPTFAFLLALAGLPFLGGCATNTMTGRSQFMIVSEQSAIARSASAYQGMIGSLEKNGKISEDEALNQRVEAITNRLIAQAIRYRPETAEWNWTIKVIEDPKTVNAFCMPGGRMAVYTGLLDKIEPTDDELAQVLGHEISHALANHGAEKMSVKIAADVAVIAVGAAASRNNRNQQAVINAAELAALAFINLPNSRTAEEEADKLGIELAARAGYHPHAAVTLWQKMMAESGSKSRFDFLSTHPASPKRVESLAALEGPMLALYDPEARMKRVPCFVGKEAASNERVVEPGEASKLAEAAPPAPSERLYFYSEVFDKFSKGEAALTCDACSAEFVVRQGSLREEYAKQSWRELALDTMKIGYGIDLAWYYLGVAAEKLGFAETAAKYFAEASKRAASRDTSCAASLLIGCGGIDVGQASAR